MKIDEILIEMIYQARQLNHQPSKILLGHYMLDELKSQRNCMVTMKASSKNHLEFMGIKIEESHEFPFLIGVC